jgi:uncharacterized protein (TIGR03000 family)
MFQKLLSFGGVLLLAGAAVLATTGPVQARGPGGGHFGGAHFGGYRGGFGGYRGGFYHGGYHYHPYYGYGYRYHNPYYGYRYGYGYPYYGYGYGFYPYGYGYYSYSYGYYPDSYGYDPYYSSSSDDSSWFPGSYNAYSPGLTTAGLTSVSPLSGGSQGLAPSGQPDTTAHVTVKVPAGADVWVDGSNTYSAGPVREFQSPPLTPGTQYSYQIRARWREDGREVTQTQQVLVSSGAHASAEFPVPPGAAGRASVTKGR